MGYLSKNMNATTLKYIASAFSINRGIFPYLVLISLGLLLVESFTYRGVVLRYLFIPVELLLVINAFSGFVSLLTTMSITQKSNIPYLSIIYKFLKLVLLLFISIYILLNISFPVIEEAINYGGRFLIYPERLLYGILLIVYFLIIYKLQSTIEQNSRRERHISPLQLVSTFVVLLLVGLILKSGFSTNLRLATYNLKNITKSPFASYREKMITQIGPIYDYYSFVNANTPENALILHPTQQGQWPDVSNAGYTRYFIYPRDLLAEEQRGLKSEEITHVFLIGNRKLHNNEKQNGWPSFYVPAERVVYYIKGSDETIVVEGDYNPEDIEKYGGHWGIIEVKKGIQW
jgi:hypothetical protein